MYYLLPTVTLLMSLQVDQVVKPVQKSNGLRQAKTKQIKEHVLFSGSRSCRRVHGQKMNLEREEEDHVRLII